MTSKKRNERKVNLIKDTIRVSNYANKIYDLNLKICEKEYKRIKNICELNDFMLKWKKEETKMRRIGGRTYPVGYLSFVDLVVPDNMRQFLSDLFPDAFYVTRSKVLSWDETNEKILLNREFRLQEEEKKINIEIQEETSNYVNNKIELRKND